MREEEWIIEWFKRKGKVSDNDSQLSDTLNYFQAGLIESVEVIELIDDIEQFFNIRFDERNFQDRRFAAIGGLSEIIRELSIK